MVTSTMTTQEAYETARAWFLKDRRYGWDPTSEECVYFGPQGQRCFVGALIPAELYRESFEGVGVGEVVDNNPELEDLLNGDDEEGRRKFRFLKRGQFLHDNCAMRLVRDGHGNIVFENGVRKREPAPIEEFIARLDDLAREFGLTVPSS